MYEDILKFGKDNFEYQVLEECNIEELLDREIYYYDLLKPTYNKIKPTDNVFEVESVQEKAQATLKKIERHWSKPIIATSKNDTINFKSISDGANYIINNNLSKGKKKTVEAKISRVCKGERKSAYGYEWKYSKV